MKSAKAQLTVQSSFVSYELHKLDASSSIFRTIDKTVPTVVYMQFLKRNDIVCPKS